MGNRTIHLIELINYTNSIDCRRIKILGEGSFGRVYLMRETKPGGRLVCAKEIQQVHGSASTESILMKKLRHPNLIHFFDMVIVQSKKPRQWIIMEYCSGGDLKAHLLSLAAHSMVEEKIWYWFVQLCLGLQHMHQQQILHRDIKTANIFLSNSGFLVLGDFGIARDLKNHDMAKTVIGTPLYMAPEILGGKPYGFASDIWALGCVLYELCTGRPPFSASSTPALINKICQGAYIPISKSKFSARMQSVIESMLNVNSNTRPSAQALLMDKSLEIYAKRYFHDRCERSKATDEERLALIQQLQPLGLLDALSVVAAGPSVLKCGSDHRISVANEANVIDTKLERQFAHQREQERQQQLLSALERLQSIRRENKISSKDLPPQPTAIDRSLNADDDRERHSITSLNCGEEMQWKEPVQVEGPRSRSDTSHSKKSTSNDGGHSNAQSPFRGIPRTGVPLTNNAKQYAARSPVCTDVRVLRKQEYIKAAERYNEQLKKMEKKNSRRKVEDNIELHVENDGIDAAILKSIQDLEKMLRNVSSTD